MFAFIDVVFMVYQMYLTSFQKKKNNKNKISGCTNIIFIGNLYDYPLRPIFNRECGLLWH